MSKEKMFADDEGNKPMCIKAMKQAGSNAVEVEVRGTMIDVMAGTGVIVNAVLDTIEDNIVAKLALRSTLLRVIDRSIAGLPNDFNEEETGKPEAPNGFDPQVAAAVFGEIFGK